MNKHSGYETYRPIEAPFTGLVAPAIFVNEGILAAFAEFRGFLARTFRRWYNEFRIARTIAEMSRLDDHILSDIGVSRDEIARAARFVVEKPGVDFRTGKAYQD
jgi:uncharacterized protein YjiS (DUF1127 family)